MITEYIKGDVFPHLLAKDSIYDVFVHGCNCFNTMGKGIAPKVKALFPEAYKADQNTVKGDKSKLGGYSVACLTSLDLFVVNAYTQYDYAKAYNSGELHLDYEAIAQVFEELNYNYGGLQFAIPKIGAGLAGGDWDRIESIINEATPDVDIHVFYL